MMERIMVPEGAREVVQYGTSLVAIGKRVYAWSADGQSWFPIRIQESQGVIIDDSIALT